MRRIRSHGIALLGILFFATHVFAQTEIRERARVQVPADAFRDDGARDLILDALALRDSAAAGLISYEATATERMRVGMAVTRRLPLRSRTLYHREQVARVYWHRSGSSTVRWIGRREGEPTLGDDWGSKAPFGMKFDIVDELGLDDIGIDLLFDPLGDRMDVFDADFVQPVSTPGLALYRFASGDTMQIRLPAPDRTITLVEVIVEPREKSWETVEGSLWFDRETGVLARAAYRPSGVWDEEIRDPHSLDDVPGLFKPAIGTVNTIVIEYGLYEQRWWLPRRVFGEGVFDWGHGLVRMPLTMEWTLAGHVINSQPGPDLNGSDLVSAGQRRIRDDSRVQRIQYLRKEGEDLASSPDLPAPLGEGELLSFTRAELEPLVRRVEQIAGPPPGPPAPRLSRELITSLRYDRVMGLSAGYGHAIETGRFTIAPSVRFASAVPDLFAGVAVSRGAFTLSAYHRLDDASDWNVANGLGNSVATVFFGHDGGDYFRADGGTLGWRAGGDRAQASIEAFAEHQRPIARQTDIALPDIGGGSLRDNIEADAVNVRGIRLTLSGQHGTDIQNAIVNWGLRVETAGGDARYARGLADLRISGELPGLITGALDLSAGLASHGTPRQREFLLGGAGTIRGVRENAVTGPAFWMTRAEVARGLPGLRAILFADAGWAGPSDRFRHGRPAAGIGLGASMLDGLLRLDIARGVLRHGVWRAYFYLDALL
jgi:hypothetical protein